VFRWRVFGCLVFSHSAEEVCRPVCIWARRVRLFILLLSFQLQDRGVIRVVFLGRRAHPREENPNKGADHEGDHWLGEGRSSDTMRERVVQMPSVYQGMKSVSDRCPGMVSRNHFPLVQCSAFFNELYEGIFGCDFIATVRAPRLCNILTSAGSIAIPRVRMI
jgi:hypothetical protein